MRRQDRHSTVPPIWRLDSCYPSVSFRKIVTLEQPEVIELFVDGRFYVTVDYIVMHEHPHRFTVEPGTHEITVWVSNVSALPSIYVLGSTIVSDDSWEVSNNTRKFVGVASGDFHDPLRPPSQYRLAVQPIEPVGSVEVTDLPIARLYDFGKQTFGYVRIHGLRGNGKLMLYYGESREEALAIDACETLDSITVNT